MSSRFDNIRLPSILLMGVVYMAYVLIGGFVFWKLEGNNVQETFTILENQRTNLMERLPCLNQNDMDTLTSVIELALKSGLSLKTNNTMNGFWKFTSSAVFAATVVTTIGYGNISPSTMQGQIFCVFFAMFGIPLNMVVLNRIGKYMLITERKICDFMETKTNHKRSVRIAIHLLSCIFWCVVFFVVPMVVFSLEEGWSYALAIYYVFITLSTIGFGDYVADSNPDKVYPEWYGCLIAVWIFFGMAWLALLINHVIDILEKMNLNLKQEPIMFGQTKAHNPHDSKLDEHSVDQSDDSEAQNAEKNEGASIIPTAANGTEH